MTRWIESDVLSNQNISSALAIGAYTSDADRVIVCDVMVDQVAGNGDYVMYVTKQIGGAGSAYVILPKTTMAAASGETAISGQSGLIFVRSGDVLTVYVDGLAGDTTTPDTIVRWVNVDSGEDIADAVADEVLTAATHNVANSLGRRIRQLGSVLGGNVSDATPTALSFITDLSSAVDDFYNDQVIVFTNGLLANQVRAILDYDGAAKRITVDEAFTSAPANGNNFDILPEHVHPITQIQAGLATSTEISALNDLSAAEVTAAVPTTALIATQVNSTLSTAHGSGLWGGASGSGAESTVITVNDGTNPLDGVEVWVTTDSAGSNVVASGVTNALGQVTFMLDAATYYVWKQHSGYNFTNPETMVVTE